MTLMTMMVMTQDDVRRTFLSPSLDIKCGGVPQGSILAPTFFLIDDASCIAAGANVDDILAITNAVLEGIVTPSNHQERIASKCR